MIKKEKIIDFSEWTVAFDFDGTLVKTTEIGVNRIKTVCSEIGLPSNKMPDNQILRSLWGMPYHDLIQVISDELLWSQSELKSFWEEDTIYELHKNPKPKRNIFINSGLRYLHEVGIDLMIISSREKKSIIEVATDAKLNLDFFKFIQGNSCHDFIKPDPRVFDPIKKILNDSGRDIGKLIYVGDTVKADFEAAKKADLKFAAIASSFISTPADFMAAGLDKKLIFTNPADFCIDVDLVIKSYS